MLKKSRSAPQNQSKVSPATVEELKRMFRFDFKNGRIFWRSPPPNRSHLTGTEAGFARLSRNGKFYWIIKINRRPCGRGVLIFFVRRGRMPFPMLDHENGDSLDDRPSNLRDADRFQNAWNIRSRKKASPLPMGVRQARSGRFVSRISHYGKKITIGTFDTSVAAAEAYQQKRKLLFGPFSGTY